MFLRQVCTIVKTGSFSEIFFMNQPVLVIVITAGIALIVILVFRNLKDKQDLENKIKNDYTHKKAGDEDIDVEEKI